jgi:hypothetical protein
MTCRPDWSGLGKGPEIETGTATGTSIVGTSSNNGIMLQEDRDEGASCALMNFLQNPCFIYNTEMSNCQQLGEKITRFLHFVEDQVPDGNLR